MECAEAGQADTVTTGASSVPPAGLSSGGETRAKWRSLIGRDHRDTVL